LNIAFGAANEHGFDKEHGYFMESYGEPPMLSVGDYDWNVMGDKPKP
jgi:hypothetical protein